MKILAFFIMVLSFVNLSAFKTFDVVLASALATAKLKQSKNFNQSSLADTLTFYGGCALGYAIGHYTSVPLGNVLQNSVTNLAHRFDGFLGKCFGTDFNENIVRPSSLIAGFNSRICFLAVYATALKKTQTLDTSNPLKQIALNVITGLMITEGVHIFREIIPYQKLEEDDFDDEDDISSRLSFIARYALAERGKPDFVINYIKQDNCLINKIMNHKIDWTTIRSLTLRDQNNNFVAYKQDPYKALYTEKYFIGNL